MGNLKGNLCTTFNEHRIVHMFLFFFNNEILEWTEVNVKIRRKEKTVVLSDKSPTMHRLCLKIYLNLKCKYRQLIQVMKTVTTHMISRESIAYLKYKRIRFFDGLIKNNSKPSTQFHLFNNSNNGFQSDLDTRLSWSTNSISLQKLI